MIDVDPLKRFLVQLPSILNYTEHAQIKHNLYSALYYIISNNSTYLEDIFPEISNHELMRMLDFKYSLQFPCNEPFYDAKSKANYTHPPDQACARTFKHGDSVFRCADCGFDDTCVLCSYCFNEADHRGHNITIYSSSGNNGGICDCGDPEAFTKELHCKCQLIQSSSSSEKGADLSDISVNIRETIRVVLDYILDVTAGFINTLPDIHSITDKATGRIYLDSERISNAGLLPSEKYGGAIDSNSNHSWCLLLWNDEYHNLQEAINSIKAGINCSESKANDIARIIDKEGFAILKESKNPEDLITAKTAVEAGGLIATIISARDHAKYLIVKHLFNWLKEVTNFKANAQFKQLSRLYLSELLLEPGYDLDNDSLPLRFIESSIRATCFENGIPYEGKIISTCLTSVRQDVDTLDFLSKDFRQLVEPNPRLKIQNSRLQFLLLFQIRLTKTIRSKLSVLIIPPLVSDPTRKQIFSKQFIEIFPSLFAIMAITDREEDLNLLSDIISQLFTCPNSIQSILKEGYIGNFLGPLTQIITDYSTKWNYDTGYPNFHDIGVDTQQNRAIKKAIKIGIHNLSHFVNKELAGKEMSALMKRDGFVMYLLFLRNFQGYIPIKRKYGDHVERENYDFEIHLEYSLPILTQIKNFISNQYNSEHLFRNMMSLFAFLMPSRGRPRFDGGVISFQVSKEPVGFVNPLHTLLSYILQFRGVDLFREFLGDSTHELAMIADVSLRSIVLNSQIKIGHWIRNGIAAAYQATLYYVQMSDMTYIRDFHINQIAASFYQNEDPSRVLKNFLHRWELNKWFSNQVSYDKTIYEDRFGSIVERFIVFVYNIITDRSLFIKESPEERLRTQAKWSIAYGLCDDAKSYSSLKKKIESDVLGISDFDKILCEVADYQPPQGLVDTGLYRLKEEMYEQLDPLSIYLDPSQFQVVSDALIKNIAKIKKIKNEDNVILKPDIRLCNLDYIDERIGDFTKTNMFVKLIYKFLQVAIDTSDETYLPQLLHLIHAILLDDELIHGHDYLNEHFVDIPISDLLLTIVESKMSKRVIQKADYLLDQLVMKDKQIIESLISCFGEEYIQSYKKRKTNLFETEAERKKRLAEERKNKILKKFSKQRQKFLSQNKHLHDDDMVMTTSDDTNNQDEIQLRVCVLCGEPESHDQPFGLLVSSAKAPIFWKIPSKPDDRVISALETWDKDLLTHEYDSYGIGYTPEEGEKIEARVLSTCGHGIHYGCYTRGSEHTNHYPCPLCHNLHSFFVPSFIPSQAKSLPDELLHAEPKKRKYNQITCSSTATNVDEIIHGLFSDDYKEYKPFMKILTQVAKEITDKRYLGEQTRGIMYKPVQFFDSLLNWSVLIADTIKMNEISTRINGLEGYCDFLNQIPGSAKTLLKSLIQGRALVSHESRQLFGRGSDLSKEIVKFWGESNSMLDGGVFDECIAWFFQGNESLATITRMGMTKLLAIVIFSLMTRLEGDGLYYSGLIQKDDPNSAVPREIISKFEDVFMKAMRLSESNGPMSQLPHGAAAYYDVYLVVEKILGIFLRNMIIFADMLTSEYKGENMYESVPEFTKMKEEIESSSRKYGTDPLTKALKVPSLLELFTTISQFETSFEESIFEIILCSKIPAHRDQGILSLDYPGIVHLVTLPADYHSSLLSVTDMTSRSNAICLLCGTWVPSTNIFRHMLTCSPNSGICFNPRTNTLRVCVHVGRSPISVEMPAPYLTIHGEVKTSRYHGKATLNTFRFFMLNKMWLNQGLYGFVTRNLFGTASTMEMPDIDLNLQRDVSDGLDFMEEDDLSDEFFRDDDDDDDDQYMF
ncbi:UBR1 [[Candida] subhashii]|uniref:E3 ubiquitin-protein ligase n=1 Tax=[Candida] subhashii TaxID=561895 RepID=A0A8J5QLM6_9ASCO|nr:UBR1 [[Candida] subhashii]KAG7662738.1 UBR1 [[Candida] subhashii]